MKNYLVMTFLLMAFIYPKQVQAQDCKTKRIYNDFAERPARHYKYCEITEDGHTRRVSKEELTEKECTLVEV